MAINYTITAPNPAFVGTVAGVDFVKGKAEAADLTGNVRAFFARHGYEVVKKTARQAPAKKDDDKGGDTKPPADLKE